MTDCIISYEGIKLFEYCLNVFKLWEYNDEISNDTVELKQTKFETCLKDFHSTLINMHSKSFFKYTKKCYATVFNLLF